MRQGRGPARSAWAVLLAVVLASSTAAAANAESAPIQASVRVMPLEISLELSATEARIGDPVKARATIRNAGSSRLANVTVELRLDASALNVKGSLVTAIPKLQPGHTAAVSWTVCATRGGNDLLLARATVAGSSIESPARLLVVAGQGKRRCA